MHQLFFKINLNKYGELKKQKEREKKTFWATAIIYTIIFLVTAGAAMSFINNLNGKIANRSKLLNAIRNEIKAYEVSGEFLTKKDLERLATISTQRIFWSKKLVALSEKTTDDIAITHFSFKNDNLSLFGITRLDRDRNEFILIDDFIKELKNDEQISKDFPAIKFVRSSHDMEKDVEILRFQIDCISDQFDERGGRL